MLLLSCLWSLESRSGVRTLRKHSFYSASQKLGGKFKIPLITEVALRLLRNSQCESIRDKCGDSSNFFLQAAGPQSVPRSAGSESEWNGLEGKWTARIAMCTVLLMTRGWIAHCSDACHCRNVSLTSCNQTSISWFIAKVILWALEPVWQIHKTKEGLLCGGAL